MYFALVERVTITEREIANQQADLVGISTRVQRIEEGVGDMCERLRGMQVTQ